MPHKCGDTENGFVVYALGAGDVDEPLRILRYACLKAPERFGGDGQLYSSTAREMLTAFKNIITEAFEDRQRSTVKHFTSLHPECKGQVWAIIKRINGWGLQEDMCASAQEYADNERRFLGVNTSVSKAWLERNSHAVLRAYVRWLNFREATGGSVLCSGPNLQCASASCAL